MLLNLYEFKLVLPFSMIIVFCFNKGLQTLLILRELTKLLHLKLTLHTCVELFTLRMDLNSNELSRGYSLLFDSVTTPLSLVDSQWGLYSSSHDTFPSKYLLCTIIFSE